MKGYWDRLGEVARAAELLQRCPIPPDDIGPRSLIRLGRVEHELREMLRAVAPHVEVWCGDPADPLRRGRPMANEFPDF